jgi:AcrR family transcriptional regulator
VPTSKREQLVETAMRLFCRDGFHATGIERILEEAGCAKMTLYNHFKSKDDLILAALRRRDELFRNELHKEIDAHADTPCGRLESFVEFFAQRLDCPDANGCMFANVSAEFPDTSSAIRAAAAEHKGLLLAYIRTLADEAGAPDPDAMAEHLALLIEGASAARNTAGRCDAGDMLRRASRVLFAQAC